MQNYTGLMIYFALATYWSLMGLLPRCQSRRRQALFSARLAPNPPWLARCTYILGGALLTNALFLDLMFWAFLFDWSSGNFFGSLFNLSVHLINAFFLLGEMALNNLQMLPVHHWYGWCYALFYLFWVWAWYLWLSPNRRTEDAWIYPFLNWNQPGWPIFYFGIPVFWCDSALQVLHGGGVLSACDGDVAGRACTRCAPGSSRGASRHRGRLRTRCCPAPNAVGGAKKVVVLFLRRLACATPSLRILSRRREHARMAMQ